MQVYELWEDNESLVAHFEHKNYHAMLELFSKVVFVESTNCAYLTERNEPVYGPNFSIKSSFFS
jgi:quinol monooxygenase YgiN